MVCVWRCLDEDGCLSGFWEFEGGLVVCGWWVILKLFEVYVLCFGYGVVFFWGVSKYYDLVSLSILGYFGEDVFDFYRIGVD